MRCYVNAHERAQRIMRDEISLKETGILIVSHITLSLESDMCDLEENYKIKLKEFVASRSEECRDKVKKAICELNKLKILRNKWNKYMNEILAYS